MPQTNENGGLDSIIKKAYQLWSKTIAYQLIFSLIYFAVLFLVMTFADSKYGILQKYVDIYSVYIKDVDFQKYASSLQSLATTPEYFHFSLYLFGCLIFLFPLNIGFFKIFRKMDLKEPVQFEDLFAGYLGSNFFIYSSYYLFWFIIYMYSMQTIILGVVWVFVTLFVAPLMFFMDKRIFDGIALTIKALKKYPLEIFVGVLLAMVFKYLGFLFFFFGGLFTFPFSIAMIYSLYSRAFREEK